jgi:hypothetical protein
MQDAASIHENKSHLSHISETDFEIQSKPTTAVTEQRPVLSRLPSIRPDPIVTPRRTHRQTKPNGYAPPASDRESWWRVTIKV